MKPAPLTPALVPGKVALAPGNVAPAFALAPAPAFGCGAGAGVGLFVEGAACGLGSVAGGVVVAPGAVLMEPLGVLIPARP